jgi:uncharacterized protein YciI
VPQYLYHFLPGERPELAAGSGAWTDADLAVARRHAAYLEAGAADGVVLVAGRSQDWQGPALVVLVAPDEAAARSFMEADPFVSQDLFRARLHPFRIAFGPLAEPPA